MLLTAATMKPNIAYWRSVLREAEHELDTAWTVAALRAAGAKLMMAKRELKRVKGEVTESESV
jgi:hypothetical protein